MSAASTKLQLLQTIADGGFYSGEDLGRQLGLSRAAVWKQIQSLQAEGLDIESVQSKGYRLLSRVELLSRESILSQLSEAQQQQIELSVLEETESTNSYLMKRESALAQVCLAEKQTAGRGRRGRIWQSPFATSLAMSLKWRFNADAGRLAGLSLAVGVVIAECLESFGIEGIALKWPNDLLLNGAKLGGILIELSGDAAGPCALVIGIGLNLSNTTINGHDGMRSVDQAWTDLVSATATPPSRNAVAAGLIAALLEMLPQFEAAGFAPFRSGFSRRDALYNRQVNIQQPLHSFTGTADGIDAQGALRVQSGHGLQIVNAGEVSVRAQ